MNDFDYSKPYSVEYDMAGSSEEYSTKATKEKFGGLLDKLAEIAQRINVNDGEASGRQSAYEWKNGEESLSIVSVHENPPNLVEAIYSLANFSLTKKEGVNSDAWTISYTSPKGKILSFAFVDAYGGVAKASAKLEAIEETGSDNGVQKTNVLYETSCTVRYGTDGKNGECRERFFSAIGKEDVFASFKSLTDGLSGRISDEKQEATDAQKAADRKSFNDALGDL